MVKLFSLPICMIFAREFLEAGIIMTQFRTIALRMGWDEERTNKTLRVINIAAAAASGVAFVMIVILAICLDVAGQDMNKDTSWLVEGLSKLVASVCLAQFSLKIPKWLGVYMKKKGDSEPDPEKDLAMLAPKSLFFNVSWNLWREMAEIGVFLLPYFLKGDDLYAQVPISAIVGIVVATLLGGLIYRGNQKTESKHWLAFWMALVMGALAVGLFSSGVGYCEKVGEWHSAEAFRFPDDKFWSTTGVGGGFFYVFGYHQHPSVLRTIAWWSAAAGMCGLHYFAWWKTQQVLNEPDDMDDKPAKTEMAAKADQVPV